MPKDIVLHFDFVNTPYTAESIKAPVRAAKAEKIRVRRRGFPKTKTAEQVGDILEVGYGLVDQFTRKYEEDIIDSVIDIFNIAAIDVLPGDGDGEIDIRTRYKPFSPRMVKFMQPRTEKIEKLFKQFLKNEEAVGSGIPTQAALHGMHLGRRTGKRRPSFIDTEIYMNSFRVRADIK